MPGAQAGAYPMAQAVPYVAAKPESHPTDQDAFYPVAQAAAAQPMHRTPPSLYPSAPPAVSSMGTGPA